MRRAFANRVDQTATALIGEACALGAQYLPINGTIDGVLFYKGRVLLVDWKSRRTRITDKQRDLVDLGWPIHFVRTVDDLVGLLIGPSK